MNKIFSIYERAGLGLEFLNKNVDKKRNCLPYFWTLFDETPAEARHDWPDFGDLTGRYVESFTAARAILGITQISETEKELRKLLLSYFSEEDGLSYRPRPERPYHSRIFNADYSAHVAEGFDQARVLWALNSWYLETKDPGIKLHIDSLISALGKLLIRKYDYGYYDRATFEPGAQIQQEATPLPNQYYFCGPQIYPLLETYMSTGNQTALEVAERLANYIVYHSDYFLADGSWNCPQTRDWAAQINGHTHSRFATIAGILKLGIIKKDNKLTVRIKKSYDWFVETHCCESGWSPEFLGRNGDKDEGCETCAIMDQIKCCLALCWAGYAEYYEKAERICRNQLFENQLLDTHLFKSSRGYADTELSGFSEVGKMVHGGFAGWAAPNDFIGNCLNSKNLMNCCGPAGIRAMYDIWNAIFTIDGKSIFLNMFLDKNSKEIDIRDYQPEQGLTEIKVKSACELYIARRSWRDKSLDIRLNGKMHSFSIAGNYLFLGFVPENSTVTLSYRLNKDEKNVFTNGRHYQMTWSGDSVIDIFPRGKEMPFYKA